MWVQYTRIELRKRSSAEAGEPKLHENWNWERGHEPLPLFVRIVERNTVIG
jgi:hypothetical protein